MIPLNNVHSSTLFPLPLFVHYGVHPTALRASSNTTTYSTILVPVSTQPSPIFLSYSQYRYNTHTCSPSFIVTLSGRIRIRTAIMVLSSHAALNKIERGGMRELFTFITDTLDSSIKPADVAKPVGLHFCVEEKIFKGTDQPYCSCPIQFLLRGSSPQTLLSQPVWTDRTKRSQVNRKARVGVKTYSVIRLDDYNVVAHKKAICGYVFFIRTYQVVKKDVDTDAYKRWRKE